MWLFSTVDPSPDVRSGPSPNSIAPEDIVESTNLADSPAESTVNDDTESPKQDSATLSRTNSQELDELFDLDTDGNNPFDEVDSSATILLVGPSQIPPEYDVCSRHISAPATDISNLLLISFVESPDERLHALEGFLDELPDQVTILNVGDPSRVGGVDAETEIEGTSVTVTSMTNPTDVMRLGMTISKTLSAWEDREGDIFVCFHSLSELLTLGVDQESIIRFLHILRGRIKAVDGSAHFHIDPTRHDADLIESLQTVFDETLVFDQAGLRGP